MHFLSGNAYLVRCTYVRPEPKPKYIISITSGNPVDVFFISSEPRSFYSRESQVIVTPTDLPFLSNDKSFINTAQINVCHDFTCVILNDYGRISDSVIDRVLEQVVNSDTLSPKVIDTIVHSLRQ